MHQIYYLASLFLLLTWGYAGAQPGSAQQATPKSDLSKDPVLYTVGYAHLDTEWRWDYETTVNDYLLKTLDDNFARFEKYKPYVFTFSGARRYRMMKEYYPQRYERLKKYVAQGRWFVGGSSVDECDANIPSPESVIRQVLYGNGYFRSEFGKESVDFMLPDCFGFQSHLPSVLAHAGVKGFSTQKLSWGSANGIPFNIGRWIGPDGNGLLAALNATDYGGRIQKRLDTASYWVNRVMDNGKKYGVYADYRYYGVGDVGGAPREEDVKNAVESLPREGSRIQVRLTSSDQLFRDLTPELARQLPEYQGDLLLTEHSAGSITSQAYMKRWNRKNEQLAMAAEPVAVAADWLGAIPYPFRSLNEAWWLVLGSQMHDILPGTSIPKAYEYAWNDEIIAMNTFSSVLLDGVGAVVKGMDTRGKGITLVVYNPLGIRRTDLVEAEVVYPDDVPKYVRVVDTAGMELPVQILGTSKNTLRILFPADVASFGFACFDVQPVTTPPAMKGNMVTTNTGLENELLKVTLNASGDIAGIIHKKLGRELLSAPSRLEFRSEHPVCWPAWNMDWDDRQAQPLGVVDGPAAIMVLERGPLRSTVKVERKSRNSVFTQYIRLAAGQEYISVDNRITWLSEGVSLKATFPTTASNPLATYNLGLGTIARPTNEEKKYEVPSREWFDLTDKSGNFGVTILEDCKFGSDKPDDRTLRLTLLYTPVTNIYHDQATQDWGVHEFSYGIYGHKGNERTAGSHWQARRFNQPLRVFQVRSHDGFLGKAFAFARISSPQVEISTIKKAENGQDIIVRLQEVGGSDVSQAELVFPAKIVRAWEVDGQEKLLGEAVLKNGKLLTDLKKFAPRSFALRLATPTDSLYPVTSLELPLPYDRDVVSNDQQKKDGRFDDAGTAFPAELLPDVLVSGGISFIPGPKTNGKKNAVSCSGQKITLPKTGNFNRISLLAAAITDTTGIFRVGGNKVPLKVQAFNGYVGSFDNRTWDKLGRLKGIEPGYIKRDEIAYFAPHLHRDTSNLPHRYGYLFRYDLEGGPGSEVLQLPDNESIRIVAITLAYNPYDDIRSAAPLYDVFSDRPRLNPPLPVTYTRDDMEPAYSVTCKRNRNLTALPGRLTMKDYADLHQPNGVTVNYFYSDADTAFKEAAIRNGMPVPALNDGMFDLLPSDSVNDRWSATGEGRLVMDLQKETGIDSIHLFLVHDTHRGSQSYSLWGATGSSLPAVTGDPASSGWQFLMFSPREDIWGNGKSLHTLKPVAGNDKPIRYLMWISEDTPHGPYYFREADIFERQQ